MKTKKSLVKPKVVVKPSSVEGWGAFATDYIEEGEIVEECHVILFDNRPAGLYNYLFAWSEGVSSLPLGYGAIYNHSDEPNCEYGPDYERQLMIFKAKKTIKPGEEIFTSYGANWFKDHNVNMKRPFSWKSFLFQDLPIVPFVGYSILTLIVLGFLLFY